MAMYSYISFIEPVAIGELGASRRLTASATR